MINCIGIFWKILIFKLLSRDQLKLTSKLSAGIQNQQFQKNFPKNRFISNFPKNSSSLVIYGGRTWASKHAIGINNDVRVLEQKK